MNACEPNVLKVLLRQEDSIFCYKQSSREQKLTCVAETTDLKNEACIKFFLENCTLLIFIWYLFTAVLYLSKLLSNSLFFLLKSLSDINIGAK